ncbi:MAG TPA: PilZ domain-containing protein, partial [Vicinamibacterales bacterium]|nr:PilZ domain-containing protein [Vicinamibacterales bacterium]
MDQPLKERRQAARFGQSVVSSIKAVLRPGLIVSLVDLSTGGARVQGSRPLRPGSQVHLLLEVEARLFGIGARVLRCSVAALDSSSGVQYWGALQFERCCRIW